jgi:hypothetical protein
MTRSPSRSRPSNPRWTISSRRRSPNAGQPRPACQDRPVICPWRDAGMARTDAVNPQVGAVMVPASAERASRRETKVAVWPRRVSSWGAKVVRVRPEASPRWAARSIVASWGCPSMSSKSLDADRSSRYRGRGRGRARGTPSSVRVAPGRRGRTAPLHVPRRCRQPRAARSRRGAGHRSRHGRCRGPAAAGSRPRRRSNRRRWSPSGLAAGSCPARTRRPAARGSPRGRGGSRSRPRGCDGRGRRRRVLVAPRRTDPRPPRPPRQAVRAR